MIDAAAVIAGISVTDEQKKMMLEGLEQLRKSYTAIRDLKMPNSVAPAFVFDPVPGDMVLDTVKKPLKMSAAPDVKTLAAAASAGVAGDSDALAFASVRELAELVKTRKVTSVELTKMYLARLKKYDPQLHFVITLTEERAMEHAAAADKEIAAGKYRGPLHGIPWGGKDLLAVKGYRTTWGAGGFEEQKFDYDATVVTRLDEAGAILIAKLSMGALAQGDLVVWRADAESMEQAAGVERVFGGKRECGSCRVRGICAGDGDAGVDLVAFDAMRVYGAAAYVWFCAEDRRDGAELDDGQDRADLPGGGGLRAGDVGDLRTGWARSFGAAGGVQLGCELQLEDAASGIHQERVRCCRRCRQDASEAQKRNFERRIYDAKYADDGAR